MLVDRSSLDLGTPGSSICIWSPWGRPRRRISSPFAFLIAFRIALRIAWYSTVWSRDLLIWLWLWFSALFIFFADTQLWFTVGCSLLGVCVALGQRGCRAVHFALSDQVHHLPERFQRKVLRYASMKKRDFAKVWNLVIQHMSLGLTYIISVQGLEAPF